MEAGRPTHLLGSVQSLSRQLGQEMMREAADEQLLKIVHDMRSPLGAIQIWIQLLKQASLGEEEEARAIQAIANSSGALGMLVDEMVDVSRLATGRLRLELRPLRLAPLIESAVAAAGPVASARGIRLLRTLHSEPGPVAGDAERIQRALRIILSNAFDFTPRGGSVDVSLKRSGSDACILVSDGGSAAHPDLFPTPPSPDSLLTKRKNEMSLQVAHQLVRLHGGSITVESLGEGRANTFTVSIPLVDPRTPPKPLGQGPMKLRPT
jgi:signal transduction histidine kinase